MIVRHILRAMFVSPPARPESSYIPFHYENSRYPRIASSPMDNRNLIHRTRYGVPVDVPSEKPAATNTGEPATINPKHPATIPHHEATAIDTESDHPLDSSTEKDKVTQKERRYGLLRPRMLLKRQGTKKPKLESNFAVSTSRQFCARSQVVAKYEQADVEYAFIAFNFGHFPLRDPLRAPELIRVASKVSQQLGYQYFWVASFCTPLTPEEEANPELKKKVAEKDVGQICRIHSKMSIC